MGYHAPEGAVPTLDIQSSTAVGVATHTYAGLGTFDSLWFRLVMGPGNNPFVSSVEVLADLAVMVVDGKKYLIPEVAIDSAEIFVKVLDQHGEAHYWPISGKTANLGAIGERFTDPLLTTRDPDYVGFTGFDDSELSAADPLLIEGFTLPTPGLREDGTRFTDEFYLRVNAWRMEFFDIFGNTISFSGRVLVNLPTFSQTNDPRGYAELPGQGFGPNWLQTVDFASGVGTGGGASSDIALFSAAMSNILRKADAGLAESIGTKLAAGQMTLAQANAEIIKAAGATTSVATLTYEFFTGKIPSLAGIDYLVSPTGSNPNNLNSAYYQTFSLENRYINFAVALGKTGEGRTTFETTYGELSLFDATRLAYKKIFGATPSDAKLHALLDPTAELNGVTMTRADYFNAYGKDGPNGLGTKAAMVGWLLGEAIKADLGMYAKANDAFLADLVDGATFGVGLVAVYGKPDYVFLPG